jgi:hypothetical protein
MTKQWEVNFRKWYISKLENDRSELEYKCMGRLHEIEQLQLDNEKLMAVVQSLTLYEDVGQELWTTCFSAVELDKLCVLSTTIQEEVGYNPLVGEDK